MLRRAPLLGSRHKSRVRILASLGMAAWLWPGGGGASGQPAPPLAWRDPAPVGRLFLQPDFEAPQAVAPGELELDLAVFYSNSLFAEANGSAAADVHVETAQLVPLVRIGVADGVEVQAALPASAEGRGFLDGAIGRVERLFDGETEVRRAGRPGGARYLLRGTGEPVSRMGSDGGLGDGWVAAKVRIADASGPLPALAIRPMLKLPTGRYPFGSGEADAGVSFHLGWIAGPIGVRAQLDALLPTGGLRVAAIRTRPYGDAQLGITWQASRRLAVHAQASVHLSPLRGTGLGVLAGPFAYALVGATIGLGEARSLEVGAVENVFSPDNRGADVTFLAALRSRL